MGSNPIKPTESDVVKQRSLLVRSLREAATRDSGARDQAVGFLKAAVY